MSWSRLGLVLLLGLAAPLSLPGQDRSTRDAHCDRLWLPALPCPEPMRATQPRPIEAAFEQIRMGMSDEELFAIMAPYEEEFTGHSQWRRWTDGRMVVSVTIWPDGGIPGRGPYRVQVKNMFKVGFEPNLLLRSNRLKMRRI